MILDGNRRWARARGMEPWKGHLYGYKAVDALSEAARDLGVHTFTVWAWSTENWERPKREIDAVMDLFRRALKEKERQFHRDQVALVHLGRKDRLPTDIRQELIRIEADTAQYSNHNVFNLAVDYGGRDEIVRATQKMIDLGIKKVDEKTFASFLDTSREPYPEPDLFIRTSGEQRTSGLLPWQMSYTEYYFEEKHLPDFTPLDLKEAILDYSRRRRRFGGNDSVEHFGFDPQVLARLELKWWRLGKIPEGTKLREYAFEHIKEQYGLSKTLASQAARLFVEAMAEENRQKFDKAKAKLKKFYKLIKGEVKLAFEPEIVASLEVRMRSERGEREDSTREYLAEVYRISLFQAAKAAHLKVLASVERNLAEAGMGEGHWAKAEDYLEKYYRALKERVA
jgi:undecaprenyl diphosphate synthase